MVATRPAGQVPGRDRSGRRGAPNRHLDRVHDREQPTVAGVAEHDHALDGRQAVPARVVGEVRVGLGGEVEAAEVQPAALMWNPPLGRDAQDAGAKAATLRVQPERALPRQRCTRPSRAGPGRRRESGCGSRYATLPLEVLVERFETAPPSRSRASSSLWRIAIPATRWSRPTVSGWLELAVLQVDVVDDLPDAGERPVFQAEAPSRTSNVQRSPSCVKSASNMSKRSSPGRRAARRRARSGSAPRDR